MNTVELDKILARNPVTRCAYIGCFASDQIPSVNALHLPFCMVINTDPSDMKGTHWVTVFCEHHHIVEYYDSAGVWPPMSAHIQKFLSQFDRVLFNRIALQSPYSSSCGKHVIFFLYHRCRKVPFEHVVRFLRTSLKSPDGVVNEFARKMIFGINN